MVSPVPSPAATERDRRPRRPRSRGRPPGAVGDEADTPSHHARRGRRLRRARLPRDDDPRHRLPGRYVPRGRLRALRVEGGAPLRAQPTGARPCARPTRGGDRGRRPPTEAASGHRRRLLALARRALRARPDRAVPAAGSTLHARCSSGSRPRRTRRSVARACCAPMRSQPTVSCTSSAPGTRGSPSRRCSRATARIRAPSDRRALDDVTPRSSAGKGQRQAMFIEHTEGLAGTISSAAPVDVMMKTMRSPTPPTTSRLAPSSHRRGAARSWRGSSGKALGALQ